MASALGLDLTIKIPTKEWNSLGQPPPEQKVKKIKQVLKEDTKRKPDP